VTKKRNNDGRPFRFFWEDDPWSELDRMHANIHRMMREFWRGMPEISVGVGRAFPIDMWETKDKLVIKANLPGVDKKNVSIRILGNELEISAEQSEEKRDVGENYFRQERVYGSYYRVIPLPVEVDEKKATAKMENGVLTIELPKKKKEIKKGKEIKVK